MLEAWAHANEAVGTKLPEIEMIAKKSVWLRARNMEVDIDPLHY